MPTRDFSQGERAGTKDQGVPTPPGPLKILGVVLARGGSKGVPGKNKRRLAGLPLVTHTLRAAKQSRYLSDVIVSTDDPEIREISAQAGVSAPFIRPPHLASDTASSVSALQHAVLFFERETNTSVDIVVELMVTNPLKTSNDIDQCIEQMLEPDTESVIAVHRLHDCHPARIKKIENGRLIDFCVDEPVETRRQDLLPAAFIRSGSIYCMTRNFLVEKGLRYESKVSRAYILPPERALNIDQEIDFLLAESILATSDSGADGKNR